MFDALHNWPDSFDFDNDTICQDYFLPFIEEQLKRLEHLDDLRLKHNPNTQYIFHEHTQRVSDNVKTIALQCDASRTAANNIAYAALLHDIGKAELPVEIWYSTSEKPTDARKDERRTHTNLGADFLRQSFSGAPDKVQNHPFLSLMIDLALYHHEQMDGQGTHKIMAGTLSPAVRLLAVVEAHDGYTIRRAHFPADRDTSPQGALEHMQKKSNHFDSVFFNALERHVRHMTPTPCTTPEGPC